MNHEEARSHIGAWCAEHLGEHLGAQVAALARTGFVLQRVRPDRPATGGCRLGGPALLEPGAPWPDYEGIPLTLLAVVDLTELAPWLGDELPPPLRSGLLNFFYLQPDPGHRELYDRYSALFALDFYDPRLCRVVPADPLRAVEAETPPGALVFDRTPLHAAPVVTLPSMNNGDEVYDNLDYGDASEALDPFGPALYVMYSLDEDEEIRLLYAKEGLERGPVCTDQFFGWPWWIDHTPKNTRHKHLLTLGGKELWSWGDGGYLHFLIEPEALRNGDFSQVVAEPDGW
ncbi:DUF1963 domain-containing protein [Streptomyces sp. NPDC004609]|uniref:DUF1963 domain-containing protein n=1 Tax=Streptomyces sp. NPDC004609 TaxID=3364704 RepID=UPI00368235F3